ncbi:FAD:protein FMN transferase [Piscinibacter sp.]|uniref:FAD:protein FMN transferase n=1 Tax=Piscinibacter sp. TaxID=1903157 RepID=UPI0039E2A512
MRRRRFLRGCLALAATPALAHDGESRVERHALAFGTRVAITIAGLPRAQAERAADAAMARIARVERAVDLHDPASPLARLNRDGVVEAPADGDLAALMRHALAWSARSEGAFDVTIQPLWQRHFSAWAQGRAASRAELRPLMAAVGWQGIAIEGDHIRLAAPRMQCTLNGLAQGYASDAAWAVLAAHGVRHALVDAGEPFAAGFARPGQPWRIGVRDPRPRAADAADWLDVLAINDAALATSGNDGFAFTRDRRLFHILDPRTGVSPGELQSATVLAADACTADALSTACMVLGRRRALDAVAEAGAQALLVLHDGRVVATRGWPGRRG